MEKVSSATLFRQTWRLETEVGADLDESYYYMDEFWT